MSCAISALHCTVSCGIGTALSQRHSASLQLCSLCSSEWMEAMNTSEPNPPRQVDIFSNGARITTQPLGIFLRRVRTSTVSKSMQQILKSSPLCLGIFLIISNCDLTLILYVSYALSYSSFFRPINNN